MQAKINLGLPLPLMERLTATRTRLGLTWTAFITLMLDLLDKDEAGPRVGKEATHYADIQNVPFGER